MKMLNKSHLAAGVASVLAVAAGGLAAARADDRGSNAKPASRPLTAKSMASGSFGNARVFTTGTPTTLAADLEASLDGPATAEFGIDTAGARLAVDTPRSSAATSPSGRWIVVPGATGGCLVTGSDAAVCGPTANLARGELAIVTPPSSVGLVAPPGQPIPHPDGAGTVQGLAPDGVTEVDGLSAAGKVLATAAVVNNVYELRVASFRDLGDVLLRRGDGTIVATLPQGS